MTKRPEAADAYNQTNEIVKRAVAKVIRNPKNSKAAKTAAGLGLARRKNHSIWNPRVNLPPVESSAD